jgi:putative heme-binding domain-containing protein
VSSILLAAMLLCAQDDNPAEGMQGLLDQQLRREDPAVLAHDARRLGDARRGALAFYQPALMCTKCHLGEGAEVTPSLGPDLSAPGQKVSDVDLVESILEPSKAIKKGYEPVRIVTDDGRTVTGLLVEDQPDAVILRYPGQEGRPITISKRRIEQRSRGGPSLMPAGLVDALGSRQQFLDLVRYLIEIAEHGSTRARALRPDPAMVSPPLPDYERTLDHAGIIAGLGPEHLRHGEAIYCRVCVNCHGTKDQPGSLPSAPRFASATLKNGSDPYSLYRTLTHGFGLMTAQTWMVPRQKYDVIHYIREAYLKPDNPGLYVPVDRAYLDRLPKGNSQGPAPVEIEPWVTMDYGPSLMATYEVSGDGSNFAFKGIAVRLDPGQGGISRGRAWMVYDHDTLRLAAAWIGQGFIDWNGINFNGRHQVHPRILGTVHVANPEAPGWANPDDESFSDRRLRGRDGRCYGPLPRSWAHYKGLYRHGDRVILAYTVGATEILESPDREIDPAHPDIPILTRTLEIAPSRDDLTMRVAPAKVAVSLVGDSPASARLRPNQIEGTQRKEPTLLRHDGFTLLCVARSGSSRVIKLLLSSGGAEALEAFAAASPPAASLEPLIHGGPRRWTDVIKTRAAIGLDNGPLATDVLTVPDNNPWLCRMRPSGFDFLPDGRSAAVCTWDGDVWVVGGIDEPKQGLTWQRIASGLFQPLGLKVVGQRIYVSCRDQIVCLRDLNGDGETDFYESFNSDHQVTEHFHEFAMGLQADAQGNFYYAKAARHGLPAVVPHHGSLLQVSKDGTRTEVFATGFRAPNGVCLNPDGTFFLSDQEGFWTPKNRINWVKRGGFYGNMWGYHDVTDPSDDAMEPPVCWITNAFDRSPAELVRVESTNPAWRPLRGTLLNFSYGNGKVFVVLHEIVEGQMQGGMCALPVPAFPTGIMRGRFHPANGQLYACGLFAWAGDRTQPGGFYRVRATGKSMVVPIGLAARRRGVAITFTVPIDRKTAGDPARYCAKTWSLKRTVNYGSDHYDERPARIIGATVSDDGRTVFLQMPELRPTWCMEVTYTIKTEQGIPVDGVVHNTIHHLRD